MKNLKSIITAGIIGLGSLGIFGNKSWGQTKINYQNIDYSSEYNQIDKWMQELYKKDSVKFKYKCYDFLNKKIEETKMEILYYKSFEKLDMAEKEHLKDNEKLFMALNKYSCESFKIKNKDLNKK